MDLEEIATTQRRLKLLGTCLGVLFLVSGAAKLGGLPSQVELFRAFGFPSWVLIAVGCWELFFGTLVLLPKVRGHGAIGLVLLMAGAVVTRAFTGVQLPMMLVDALLFSASVWVVLKQRPAFLAIHWQESETPRPLPR